MKTFFTARARSPSPRRLAAPCAVLSPRLSVVTIDAFVIVKRIVVVAIVDFVCVIYLSTKTREDVHPLEDVPRSPAKTNASVVEPVVVEPVVVEPVVRAASDDVRRSVWAFLPFFQQPHTNDESRTVKRRTRKTRLNE